MRAVACIGLTGRGSLLTGDSTGAGLSGIEYPNRWCQRKLFQLESRLLTYSCRPSKPF
jgi:hypothetical protein